MALSTLPTSGNVANGTTAEPLIESETPVEENGVPDPQVQSLVESEGEDVLPDAELSTDQDYSVGILNNYLQALPLPGDDLDAKLTPAIRDKMLLDSIIQSTFSWIISAATDKDPSFEPTVLEKTDPEFATSKNYHDFCMRAIAPVYDRLPEILCDMGNDALSHGNKAAERVCSLQLTGPDAGKYYLRDVKPRGYDSYAYITDPHMNLIYVAVRTVEGVDGEGRPITPGPSRPTKINLNAIGGGTGIPTGWKILPADKFSVLTLRKKNGDPRGASALRHIYNEWWLIQSIFPMYLKYLLKFASPSIVVTAPEGPPMMTIKGKQVSVAKSILRDLKGFENASATVLPGKATFQLVQSQSQGEAFLGALSMLEQRIQIGITNQVLASSEGKHMARAAAQTHQDSRNVVVRAIRRWLENVIRDLFRYLLKINFGEEAVKYAPTVNLGRVDPEDMGAIMSGIASLKTAGYFSDEQARGLDSIFSFPRREENKFPEPPAPTMSPGGAAPGDKKPVADKKPKPSEN